MRMHGGWRDGGWRGEGIGCSVRRRRGGGCSGRRGGGRCSRVEAEDGVVHGHAKTLGQPRVLEHRDLDAVARKECAKVGVHGPPHALW